MQTALVLLGVLMLFTGLTGFITTFVPIRRLGLTRKRGLALWVGSFVAFLVLALLSSSGPNRRTTTRQAQPSTTVPDPRDEQTGPQVRVFAEDQSETPGAAKVERQITFDRLPTVAELDRTLRSQFEDAMRATRFQRHSAPTVASIYAYHNEETGRRDRAAWIGMILLTPSDDGPKVSIDERAVAALGEPEEERFDLTEAERRACYWELVAAEDRATAQAMAQHPADLRAEGALRNELMERYAAEAVAGCGITAEQADELSVEGYLKRWPKPDPTMP